MAIKTTNTLFTFHHLFFSTQGYKVASIIRRSRPQLTSLKPITSIKTSVANLYWSPLWTQHSFVMISNFHPVKEVVTQLEVAREQDLTVNRVHLASSPAKQRKPLPLMAPHGWQNATIYKPGRKKGVGGEREREREWRGGNWEQM